MWFRRLFRRRRKPPLDLSALEELERIVVRVIALVPEVSPEVGVTPTAVVPQSAPDLHPELIPDSHLIFVPGYELVERPGPPPPRGERLEHEGRGYRVLRHGPSPLPGDRRRCVFLESL